MNTHVTAATQITTVQATAGCKWLNDSISFILIFF